MSAKYSPLSVTVSIDADCRAILLIGRYNVSCALQWFLYDSAQQHVEVRLWCFVKHVWSRLLKRVWSENEGDIDTFCGEVHKSQLVIWIIQTYPIYSGSFKKGFENHLEEWLNVLKWSLNVIVKALKFCHVSVIVIVFYY